MDGFVGSLYFWTGLSIAYECRPASVNCLRTAVQGVRHFIPSSTIINDRIAIDDLPTRTARPTTATDYGDTA